MKTNFEKQLKNDLTNLENECGLDVRTQLTAVRKQAINSYRKPWIRYLQQTLWPAAGMTLASLLVFMVVLGPTSSLPTHHNLVIDEQNSENVELLEDLDFYYWLSENEAMLRG